MNALVSELRRVLDELSIQGAAASAFVTFPDGESVEITGSVDRRRPVDPAEVASLH